MQLNGTIPPVPGGTLGFPMVHDILVAVKNVGVHSGVPRPNTNTILVCYTHLYKWFELHTN